MPNCKILSSSITYVYCTDNVLSCNDKDTIEITAHCLARAQNENKQDLQQNGKSGKSTPAKEFDRKSGSTTGMDAYSKPGSPNKAGNTMDREGK